MQIRQEVLTAENVKNRFTGKEEKVRTLVAVFEDHNQKMESLAGQEFEKSTLQRYKTCLMHVQDFLKLQHNLTAIPVDKITFKRLNDSNTTYGAYVNVAKTQRSSMSRI